MSISKPVNAILAYESTLYRSRTVELDVYTDEDPDTNGAVWARTASGARLMIDRERRVWWITDRKEGWKRDREARHERICGRQGRFLPLPQVGRLSHLLVKGDWILDNQGETNG